MGGGAPITLPYPVLVASKRLAAPRPNLPPTRSLPVRPILAFKALRPPPTPKTAPKPRSPPNAELPREIAAKPSKPLAITSIMEAKALNNPLMIGKLALIKFLN